MFSGLKSAWESVSSFLSRKKSNTAEETNPTETLEDSDDAEETESNKHFVDFHSAEDTQSIAATDTFTDPDEENWTTETWTNAVPDEDNWTTETWTNAVPDEDNWTTETWTNAVPDEDNWTTETWTNAVPDEDNWTTETFEVEDPASEREPTRAGSHPGSDDAGIQRLADDVRKSSKLTKTQSDSLPVYKIKLTKERMNIRGCQSFTFGADSTKHNRTIMVLGATGAGKSTLINGMINYILGVKWNDPYRFKLVDEVQSKSQAHSQTSEVTVYKLNHQEGFKTEYSLTIVDTPGFGDTRGIKRDKEITEQLRNLFSSTHGVSEIDAVCFVAQAALARLTPSQRYVFDSVLSIFGKDVAENIRVLVTFADGKRPPVLEAINESGIPCPKTEDGLPLHFKFNNSALFADNKSSAADSTSDDDEEGDFDQMFWNMGAKSMKRFFAALNLIETKSLTLTNEVLRGRKELENSVENLQKKVKLGLAKLEEIRETAETLKEHEAEISRNENFEFNVTVKQPVQEDISGTGNFITNCQQCHFTCHYPCMIPGDANKKGCAAIGPDGNCKECPGKCVWSVHYNQKYKWQYEDVQVKKTVKELKEKYLKAAEAKAPVQILIDRLRAEYDAVQTAVVKLMDRSAKCLNRLKEIALKPNPLSTPEYIDMLIEGEKTEAKSGWKKRVQYLNSMRQKAEYMAKVDSGENLLQSPPEDFLCNNGPKKRRTDRNTPETNAKKPRRDHNRQTPTRNSMPTKTKGKSTPRPTKRT